MGLMGNITTDPRQISREANEAKKKLLELEGLQALSLGIQNKEARLAEIAASSAGELQRTQLTEAGAKERAGMTLAEEARGRTSKEVLATKELGLKEKLATPEIANIESQTAARNIGTNILSETGIGMARTNLQRAQALSKYEGDLLSTLTGKDKEKKQKENLTPLGQYLSSLEWK
jgi:hypothetical protein